MWKIKNLTTAAFSSSYVNIFNGHLVDGRSSAPVDRYGQVIAFFMVLYIAGGAGIFPSNKMIDLVQNHGRKAEHKETFADRNCMKVCTSRWQSECYLERNSRTKNVYMQSRPPNGIIFQSEASQLTFSLVVRYGVSHVYFIVRVATLRNQPTISHHTM